MQPRLHPSSRHLERGLSLVEILVGVAIGMIGVVAIFQAVAVWTKHTQTTSSGGDAQIAGTLALFNIERDLKQAGHGFATAAMPVMGCDVQAATGRGAVFNFPAAPGDHRPGAAARPTRSASSTAIRRSSSTGRLHRLDGDQQEAAPSRRLQAG